MKRLLVVADDPMVVQWNRFALRHAAGFRVVATVDGRGSARAELARLQPDIVLINEMCQRTNVIAQILEACEESPEAKVVLLSGRMGSAAFDDAFEAGAHAVLSRNVPPVTLGILLREVANGNVVSAPHVPRARAASERGAQLHAVAGHDAPAARTSA